MTGVEKSGGFIADSYGGAKRPLSSKFITVRDRYRCATVDNRQTFTRIDTIRYSALVVLLCCGHHLVALKRELKQLRIPVFIPRTNRLYSHLPRNPSTAGHRLILLGIGNKLPVSPV